MVALRAANRNMFSAMSICQILLSALLLLSSSVVMGQGIVVGSSNSIDVITTPGVVSPVLVSYQILPFTVKLTVNDKGFDMNTFQTRFEGIMALHLTNYFFKALPNGNEAWVPLNKDIFDKVELRTRLAKTYVGAPGGESRVEAGVSGAAYFNFANAYDAPLGNATLVRQAMTTITLEAFQGREYLTLLDLYLEDDILREVTGINLFVENTLIAGGGIVDPNVPDSPNDRNTAEIAASVACLFVVMVGLFIFFLVKNNKTKQKRGRRGRKGEGDTQSPEQSLEQKEGATSDPDTWMDEWSRSITSIPLRDGDKNYIKTAKPKHQSRPATRHARKVWLFCKCLYSYYTVMSILWLTLGEFY
jgi:hypothetical protein